MSGRSFEYLTVNRNDLVKSTISAVEKFKDKDWNSYIKIRFAGEDAYDIGGPIREFLSIYYRQTTCIDNENLTCFYGLREKKEYKILGRLMALGCVVGHPGPQCFMPAVVDYILTGIIPPVSKEDAKDASLREAIRQVVMLFNLRGHYNS